MKRARLLPLALSLLVAAATAAAASPATPPRAPAIDVQPGTTTLTFPALDAAPVPGHDPTQDEGLGAVIALPPDATRATATLVSGRAGEVTLAGKIMRLRGLPVVVVQVREPGPGSLTVAVSHDGNWQAKSSDRLVSPALQAALPGLPSSDGLKSVVHPLGGSYVIISAPQFAETVAPLADWKTRKGWPVVLVTTDEIGNTGAGIRAYLQDAYDSWVRPPEYVLLVGDVEDIPTYFIDGNVTDLPYTLVDGDDWLPDLMLGRFAVANQSECEAMVAKTLHYEREPYQDQTHWFTRGVMIGGQYGSTTPMHTVRFCGEQLQSIGFSELVPVTPVQLEGNYIVAPYIPQDQIGIPVNMGPSVISSSIDAGSSFVVYRGWAYGTGGWFSPTYQVADVQNLDNGAMLPVVMSFVCHTGNFNAGTPSMGEVFTRMGGSDPADFRGAVAFYGNGEPWSRTRYNDAMAISLFERITEPQLSTLGSLVNAGKLRFMEFFPGSMEESGDGFSVEFYFHIYNLLGDPELNYYRAQPTALTVAHAAELPVGSTLLDVAVTESGSGAPLAGARIGLVQDGELLGAALTDAGGLARVVLTTPATAGAADLTVTHPDRLAYTSLLNTSADEAYLVLDDLMVSDPLGEPIIVQPGVELALLPTLRNLGSEQSGEATLNLTTDGPVTITTGSQPLAPLDSGDSGAPTSPFTLTVDADADDGALIQGYLEAAHGDQSDASGFELRVQAPEILATAATTGGEAWVEPGTTADLTLTVRNQGSLATSGGELAFSLDGHPGVVLLTESLAFGDLPPDGEPLALGPVSLQLDDGVAGGSTVNLRISAEFDAGSVQVTSVPIPVGRGEVTEPSGPDQYGYYAYDSADLLYPDQRPVYRWREISTAYGGDGTRLPLNNNNLDRQVIVELPFDFTFYGVSYDRVRVSDNGWLSFDADNDFYNFYNWPIPLAHGNSALVAPFWDNLTPEPLSDPEGDPVGMGSDGIYWYHDAAAGEVIFQWSRMRHIYNEVPELQTFPATARSSSSTSRWRTTTTCGCTPPWASNRPTSPPACS